MKSISITEARKIIYSLVDETTETNEPIKITGKRNNAILISEEDWRAIQETLYLVSIPGMRESIQEGLKTPLKDTTEEIDW